nr:PIN domain-containing protein [Acidovorax sp. SRB_24]
MLVDWENVQPRGPELRALVPESSDVWLFHGPAQKVDASSHQLAYGASKVTLVPRSGGGKNALDFHLSYYMGYISARQPQEQFVVVSNDKGYDAMLAHARELGFDAQRREFVRPPQAPVALPAKPQATPAPGHRRKLASMSAPLCVVTVAPMPALDPSAAQIAWRSIVHLRQLAPQHRPVEQASWQVLIESLIHEPVSDKAALALRACQLVQGRSLGIARAPANETKERKPSPAPAAMWAPPIATATVCSIPVQRPVADNKPVAVPKTAQAKPATKKAPTPGKPVVPVPEKVAATSTALQIAQRVLSSLKKMPSNKPRRHAGLLKLIATHISAAASHTVTADQVCALLQQQKHVTVWKDGLGVTYPKLQPSSHQEASRGLT